MADGPYPLVDLLWYDSVDPRLPPGMAAPLKQLLIRTDIPSIFYKQGLADTDWVEIGAGVPGALGVVVENQGIAIPNNPHSILNFTGAGVVASDAGAGQADITIPGGTPAAGAATEYFDDFLSDRLSFFSVSGGGTNGGGGSAMGNNHPGTYTQTVTAAGADGARITCAQANGSSACVFFGGGVVTWESIHQIPTLSDGVNRIDMRTGMHDGGGVAEPSDGCYLEYSLALDGNQNYWLCASNNGARTKVDTGIIALAGSNRKVILTVNAAGTVLSATIDGVASALTVVSNIPVTAARNTFVANLQLVKALGAGALTAIHDYYKFTQTFTVAR